MHDDCKYRVEGYLDGVFVMDATFDSVNDARIFAKRAVGYPFDNVKVSRLDCFSLLTIHDYYPNGGGWVDNGPDYEHEYHFVRVSVC